MKKLVKRFDELTPADLESFPFWQFTNENEEELDETAVTPLKRNRVVNVAGLLVGTKVRLASGRELAAIIGNVDQSKPRAIPHLVTLSIYHQGRWFTLGRYHDVGLDKCGPQALARFLKMPIDDVFPISYDIRRYTTGDPSSLVGNIEKEPNKKLTFAQILDLAD